MRSKRLGIIVLLVVILIFAVQNTQTVNIKFLFWGFETSAVLSILVSFFIGALVGWLMQWIGAGKKKAKESIDSAL